MRRLNYFKILFLLPGLFFIVINVRAQSESATDSTAENDERYQSKLQQQLQPESLPDRNEFSVWMGFALDSFQLWGKTQDVHIQSLGFRYNRKLIHYYNAILEYNLLINLYSNYSYQGFEPYAYKSSLSGFGVSPLGLQLNFFSNRTFQPFINTSAGLMFMDKPFPDNRGKKLNFTFDAGGGVEIMLLPSLSFSLGVKYHHFSNGERGQINPGVDSYFYYTSITIF